MKHTPDINVISALKVKNQVGIALERPSPQSWQIQFVGVPQRTRSGMASYVGIGSLQCIDKGQGHLFTRFQQVEIKGLLNVNVSPDSR